MAQWRLQQPQGPPLPGLTTCFSGLDLLRRYKYSQALLSDCLSTPAGCISLLASDRTQKCESEQSISAMPSSASFAGPVDTERLSASAVSRPASRPSRPFSHSLPASARHLTQCYLINRRPDAVGLLNQCGQNMRWPAWSQTLLLSPPDATGCTSPLDARLQQSTGNTPGCFACTDRHSKCCLPLWAVCRWIPAAGPHGSVCPLCFQGFGIAEPRCPRLATVGVVVGSDASDAITALFLLVMDYVIASSCRLSRSLKRHEDRVCRGISRRVALARYTGHSGWG